MHENTPATACRHFNALTTRFKSLIFTVLVRLCGFFSNSFLLFPFLLAEWMDSVAGGSRRRVSAGGQGAAGCWRGYWRVGAEW